MKHSHAFLKLVEETKARIREMTVVEVRRKQAEGQAFAFVDVREDNEWAQGHAAGAEHIGRGVLERDIENQVPDRDREIVLYCGGGFRSALAAENLQKMSYRRVFSMAGGIGAWREQGLPEEEPSEP